MDMPKRKRKKPPRPPPPPPSHSAWAADAKLAAIKLILGMTALFWGTATCWLLSVLGGVDLGLQGKYYMVARLLFVAAVPLGCVAVWCAFGLLSSRVMKATLGIVCCLAC